VNVLCGSNSGLSNVSISLLSPSGVEFHQDDPNYIEYGYVRKFVIANPENGLWHLAIDNTNITQAFYYSFTSEVKSDIICSLSNIPAEQSLSEPFIVTANVFDYLTPLEDATVQATISRDTYSYTIPPPRCDSPFQTMAK